jgi:hypothetical protein
MLQVDMSDDSSSTNRLGLEHMSSEEAVTMIRMIPMERTLQSSIMRAGVTMLDRDEHLKLQGFQQRGKELVWFQLHPAMTKEQSRMLSQ